MTLLIAAANDDMAVLASDRRLSWQSNVQDDETNKATFVAARDARAAFAFTGLARTGSGFETQAWFLETLSSASKQNCTIEGLVEAIARAASATFPSLTVVPDAARRVAFLGIGFTYFEGRPVEARAWLVSNLESDVGSKLDFQVLRDSIALGTDAPPLLRLGGATTAADSVHVARFRELLARRAPRAAIEGKAIDVVRRAARRASVVGPQAGFAYIPSGVDTDMEFNYYTAHTSTMVYAASAVFALTCQDAMVLGDGVAAFGELLPTPNVPRVGRNVPCPCGSGMKYKDCHSGLTYAYLPLSAEIAFEEPHPGYDSGRRFIVRNRGTAGVTA
jgi:hypothetical protein